jgi:hypothetical protein
MPVRRVGPARWAAAAAAVVLLASCGDGGSSSTGAASSGPVASSSPTSSAASGAPTGSPSRPARLTASQDLLAWKPVPGPTGSLVTVGDGWTLTVMHGGRAARLAGPHPRTIRAGDHASITDAFLDAHHALVVSEDRLAQDADRATLVDLSTGRAGILDDRAKPPTVSGGTWALGPTSLVHATSGPHHRYCLALVDLASGQVTSGRHTPGQTGDTGWCAPPRHGFSQATITADGTTMMTFDAHHPSCRSLNVVHGSRLSPLSGVTRCRGWDSALLGDTTVWSVVPNEHRIEAARFFAHTDTGWYALGRGTSGSLVACAGAAYFTRDPASRTDPATLLRWSPTDAELTVAYSSQATGNAFLSPPRCGGSHLTVTAYSDAGDVQVSADLG